MKRSEAAKIWTMLATAYAEGMRWLDTDQREATAKLYEDFLVDLDYRAADAAIRRLIATWKPTSANRYPSIPTVREAVLAQTSGRMLAGGEAWGVVQRLIGRYGVYRTPGEDFTVSDPVAAKCIDALGWRELCSSENATADRARFIELYDRLAVDQRETAIVAELAPPRPDRALGSAPVAALLPEPKA